MFSPEDDQDDNNIFDKLRSIRPFTVDQLYLLHPDVGCPPKTSVTREPPGIDDQGKFDVPPSDNEVYQHLVEHEQLRNHLVNLKHSIKKLYKKTYDNVDSAWTLKEESTRKIAMCQEGKIAETTFKYKQAHIDERHLDTFSQEFSELIDLITKDYIYYSFESQMKRNKIATQLAVSYQMPDVAIRKAKLKSAIVTLIEFLKYLGDIKSNFVVQCRKWLRALCKRYLHEGTTNDYRFIISQLAMAPAGTADWSADLVECKPYEQVSNFDSVPQYITHCSTLLCELFYGLQLHIEHLANKETAIRPEEKDETLSESSGPEEKENYTVVDSRFTCFEELDVSLSSRLLSETDVIKFCLKIPVAQIFRAYVKKCLDKSDEFGLETDKNYEFIMLKLLTIGTIIIKTYQIGLETFNSIQYGSLIEYLSSQIRRTVIILSDQWSEFKLKLRGIDDALLMRLQVEYDNFMLRSISVILELRQSGIWRHLSRVERDTEHPNGEHLFTWSIESLRPGFAKLLEVTGISTQLQQAMSVTTSETLVDTNSEAQESSEKQLSTTKSPATHPRSSSSLTYEFSIEWFKDVSEPMLWHILWQFYHNAFISSCDYHSDNYWLEKFQEKSVVYLFVNKMKDSPPGECSYLLNSITSMLLSRTRPDSKLVQFIATEIFNLTFEHKSLKEKVARKGIKSLIRCAERFPELISQYMSLMSTEVIDDDAVDFIRGCSLTGWLCNEEEFYILENWLIDYPLEAPQNKLSRLIISKILLNSPSKRSEPSVPTAPTSDELSKDTKSFRSSIRRKISKRTTKHENCFVDLNLRRKLALLLYHASVHHLPEPNQFGPQSLGASVEVAFGAGLFCEPNEPVQNNLLELSVDSNYQQFYIWTWRILFTLRLHILNQPETDWNDVQSRSDTSRSIRNTVLVNDSFHPVPSLEDSECSALSEGIKNQNPVASFIYLFLTDVTWQSGTIDTCLNHLNILAKSGHITPSLMAMKFFTICHLNDLSDVLARDKKCIEYFTSIVLSNFDATRLASLMITQLDHLKQYRQIQLSQFYVTVLLDVNTVISKQISSSWFSNNEISLEKIACLLDYIVRFNFATQRIEIIRKFYDCAYVIDHQAVVGGSGWLSSFLTSSTTSSSSASQRDFLTNLHVLAQKFKKYTWLQWAITECDTLRLEKVWEDIVAYLSGNEEANLDMALKKVCPQINSNLLKSTLPIYSWIRQIFDIMEADLNHPLCPLIWYNFFLNYFANSLNGVSVGVKLVSQETLARLLTRLDSLYNYHTYKQRNWSSTSAMQQNSLTQLYKAYKLWLQDPNLQNAYVDMDRLKDDYLVPLLNAVMESSNASACLQYVDLDSIETQNKNLIQVWVTSTRLTLNNDQELTGRDPIMYLDNNESQHIEADTNKDPSLDDGMADDAISLIAGSLNSPTEGRAMNKILDEGHDELNKPLSDDLFGQQKYQTTEELMNTVKEQFVHVFEESSQFGLNISELERTKSEITELVRQLYTNKKREMIRVAPCLEGHECAGPARIKLEVEEALMDERKSQCIQDRRRQCQELVGDLLLMPKNRSVQATVVIEDYVRRLISDPQRTKMVIETLLRWLSEPSNYNQLNGTYYAAKQSLNTVLEILSTTEQVDTFNRTLIDVCLAHPGSVQIFSPHLTPSLCASDCFLDLYKIICHKQLSLDPMATFVVLSKFDLNSWLLKNTITGGEGKKSYHELIVTTCSAFRDIGKVTDESNELTTDLFKRHIQIELASPDRRKPEELSLVLNQFLILMSEQVLPPGLWLDFLNIVGLERSIQRPKSRHLNKSSSLCSSPSRRDSNQLSLADTSFPMANLKTSLYQEVTVENAATIGIVDDVIRLAECQSVLDYHSLDALMKSISKFMKSQHEASNVTLLELYQDYLEQYGVLMLSVTFMWLKSTSEMYPDNHELIWKQFMELWFDWVFLTKNCQNVGKSSYSLMVNYFVASLGYMIRKIPDSTQSILKSLLAELAAYIAETREIVYLELTILQRCLKNLPWSVLLVSPSDINNLASLSQQENYNVSDLVSHIMLQVNTKISLARIQQQIDKNTLVRAVEQLATIIVLQSADLKGYRLDIGSYFCLIPVESIPNISSLILARMEFANLEHSQNNKLLVNLLRFICIRLMNSSNDSVLGMEKEGNANNSVIEQQKVSSNDSLRRSIEYSRFVSNYMIDLIKRHPKVTSSNRAYLNAVMDNSLQDLKPLILSSYYDLKQKTHLYGTLLECCSCELLDHEARFVLAMSVVNSTLLKGRPIVVLEILHAVGQILRNGRILVPMVETLVDLYLKMNGHYERATKSFCLASLSSDTYLNTCIELRAPLALVVFFESLVCGRQPPTTIEPAALATEGAIPIDSGSSASSQGGFDARQIWPSFFHWMSLLTQAMGGRTGDQQHLTESGPKLTTAWLRMLTMLEPKLKSFLLDDTQQAQQSASGEAVVEEPATGISPQSTRANSESGGDNTSQNGNTSISEGRRSKSGSIRDVKGDKNKKPTMSNDHKTLVSLIKQLIALYDTVNSGGIWSYLKSSNKSEQSVKISITSLGVACFLADRALLTVNNSSSSATSTTTTTTTGSGGSDASMPVHLVALCDELAKQRKTGLSKLEVARKSKSFMECAQFIDSLIESVQQNNKVQYGEVVQLITTFSRVA